MKVFLRLVATLKPYHHFLPEYIVYSLLSIVFGVVNYTLLIPVLNLLFNQVDIPTVLHQPTFAYSIDYAKDIFYYTLYSIILSYGKMMALGFVCGIIFCCIFLSNLFKYLGARIIGRIKIKLLGSMRERIYNHLIHQDLSFHYRHKKGEHIAVLMNDVQELEVVGNAIQNMLKAPLVIIIYIGVLFYLSAPLTLFTIIFFPLSGFVVSSTIKKLKKKGHYSQATLAAMLAHAEESLSGIKIIKAFSAQSNMKDRFKALNNQFTSVSRTLFNQRELASPLSEFLGVSIMLVLVLYGGYLIMNTQQSSLSGSVFITYLAIYSQMIPPLKDISMTITQIQKAEVSGERVFQLLDDQIKLKQDNTKEPDTNRQFEKHITIRNMTFGYHQDTPVLKNINLTINKGETVALVGKSGSGKTTLVDLLFRFYDIDEGGIFIDDHNIKNMPQRTLHNLMGIVTQDPFLFNDSILNNIVFGADIIDKTKVEDCCQIAYAHDFIMALDDQYNTNIGDRGMKLSGGQRQRITIARALYKNPPILILDEATASLDTQSEQFVQSALDNAMKDRTCIIIAHRLSTVKNADKIIVMDKGEIIEVGTHQDLLAQKGAYYDLVQMQHILHTA